MARLEIDFVDSTDRTYEHLIFRQEGMRGMKLPCCWLPEFIEGLERPNDPEAFCIYHKYFVLNSKHTSKISVYANDEPLLQLSSDQRAKLIAHLKSTYAELISVYR